MYGQNDLHNGSAIQIGYSDPSLYDSTFFYFFDMFTLFLHIDHPKKTLK